MRTPLPQIKDLHIVWTAVFTGFLVDYTISALIVVFARPDELFFTAPNLANTTHLLYLALFTLSTGVGGYIAGRVARMQQALHGLLVGVVGILLNQLQLMSGGPPPPHAAVVASAIGCALGALGGWISIHASSKPRL